MNKTPEEKKRHAMVEELVQRYPVLVGVKCEVMTWIDMLVDAYSNSHTLFVCGNGGSAADAQHIVGELMKSFHRRRPLPEALKRKLRDGTDPALGNLLAEKLEVGLAATALGESFSFATAFVNDAEPSLLYAQQLLTLARPGDVLLAISTSGRSANVRAALQLARCMDVRTIGLTGGDAGAFPSLCDVTIAVPESETYRIQELHLPIYHAVCLAVEGYFFGETRTS